jgi:hypothetical protein
MSLVDYSFDFNIVEPLLKSWINNQKRFNPQFTSQSNKRNDEIFVVSIHQILNQLMALDEPFCKLFGQFRDMLINDLAINVMGFGHITYPEVISVGSPPNILIILPKDKYVRLKDNRDILWDCVLDLASVVIPVMVVIEHNAELMSRGIDPDEYNQTLSKIKNSTHCNKIMSQLIKALNAKVRKFVIPESYKFYCD